MGLADSLGAQVRWHAVGKSGARSQDVANKLTSALPPDPADVFLVSVGVNDVTGLVWQANWIARLAAVLDGLRAHSPGATIALSGLPPLGEFPLLPQPLRFAFGVRARMFDLAAARVARDVEGVIHVPLEFESAPEKFSDDGFHPSEAGYAVYGRAMADAIVAARLSSVIASAGTG